MRRLNGLKEANDIAKSRSGKCLSRKYINARTPMLWKCSTCLYHWKARLNDIKQGKWCPKCAKTLKLSISDARVFAKNKDGKCLSKKYINSVTKMKWQCDKKHIWFATFISIKNGTWCPYCSKRILLDGLGEAQLIARKNNGKCLSRKYINANIKMKWQCNKKHIWKARFHNIKSGNWCPECAQIKRAKSSNNSRTLYHWKTGEELVCQASWEKKVVEYFNKNKINFRWQPRSFIMPDGRKYYPDCYLYSTKKWIEIKGYFRKDAKEKWEWFHKEKHNSELWDFKRLKEMKIIKR